ncbi:MAG: amidohydrolase family protein [Blastocatellia bacterium]
MDKTRALTSTAFALLVLASLLISSPTVSGQKSKGEVTVLVGGTVYTDPTSPPIPDGAIVIKDGKIAAIGKSASIRIPAGASVINCDGLTLTAGFWNSHVHFTDLEWDRAGFQPVGKLTTQLREMLTKYGFTSVFDTGSFLTNTQGLRDLVNSGVVLGPRILTAGEIIFPEGGPPSPAILKMSHVIPGVMPTAATPEQGVEIVDQHVKGGADAIKIYGETWFQPVKVLPYPVVKAITDEAHKRGKPVLVHPSAIEGLTNAIHAGVDVIVHTAPESGPWDAGPNRDLIAEMKRKNIALIPTLTLWRLEVLRGGGSEKSALYFQNQGVAQLAVYFKMGGLILFGTDVGYTSHFDTTEEYQAMFRAGLGYRDILASLTTNPSSRWGYAKKCGKLAPGMDADITVLESDAASDVTAFSRVRMTIRAGRIIYDARPH